MKANVFMPSTMWKMCMCVCVLLVLETQGKLWAVYIDAFKTDS